MDSEFQKTMSVPSQLQDRDLQPYKLSYIDRFMEAVLRLPFPYWVTYLSLFFLQSLLFHILSWIDGWVPPYAFNPILLLFPQWLWGPLLIMTYLNKVSLDALSSFSPLLNIREKTMSWLRYTFTTMPPQYVVVNGFIWTVFYFLITYLAFDAFYVANNTGPVYAATGIILGIPSFFVGSVITYHSIRQLILVNRVMKMVRQFNLFRLDPVYAFSRLTSQTGIAWILMLSLTLLIFPLQLASTPVLVMLLGQVVLTLAAFVLPLWIAHQRLVGEKQRLLADVNQRVEALLSQLHQFLDENKLNDVGQLNEAISGLIVEREVLNKIPTWPWRAGTLSGFLTATLLPIVLFLIQVVLGRMLGD